MGHAVLPNAPTADVRLPPVYPEQRRATPPESKLIEVFIPGDLNLFGINADWGRPYYAQSWCNASPFRINTCKSVSKQTTLTIFRMNTYEKTGGGGYPPPRGTDRGRMPYNARDLSSTGHGTRFTGHSCRYAAISRFCAKGHSRSIHCPSQRNPVRAAISGISSALYLCELSVQMVSSSFSMNRKLAAGMCTV